MRALGPPQPVPQAAWPTGGCRMETVVLVSKAFGSSALGMDECRVGPESIPGRNSLVFQPRSAWLMFVVELHECQGPAKSSLRLLCLRSRVDRCLSSLDWDIRGWILPRGDYAGLMEAFLIGLFFFCIKASRSTGRS